MPVVAPVPNERIRSTDMGDISQLLPAIHAYPAIAPEATAGHSTDVAAAAVSKAGAAAVLNGASAWRWRSPSCSPVRPRSGRPRPSIRPCSPTASSPAASGGPPPGPLADAGVARSRFPQRTVELLDLWLDQRFRQFGNYWIEIRPIKVA